LIYVNKLDRDGASFKRSVLAVASKLNTWPLVCQIPLWEGDHFVGVVDIIQRCGWKWTGADKFVIIPEGTLRKDSKISDEMDKARAALIEKLCEVDEVLFDAFSIHENDIPPNLLRESIRRAIRNGENNVAPVFAGSSLRGMGVEPLLNAVVDYLPSPADKADIEVTVGSQTRFLAEVLASDANKPTAKGGKSHHHPSVGAVASVFKVVYDNSVAMARGGMTAFVRIYQGTLNKNSQLWNANIGEFEKATYVLQVAANHTSEIPHLSKGQIGAVTGLQKVRTGDTLQILPSHSHQSPNSAVRSMRIRPPPVAPPVAFLSLEAFTKTERDHLHQSLEKLSREDPSLRTTLDMKSEVFTLSGMGKLHLEVAVDRLKNHYLVKAQFGTIQVDYKECLLAPTEPHRYPDDRVVAAHAGKAACTAAVRPLDAHGGVPLPNSAIERDGNIFTFDMPVPERGILPFNPDVVRKQLFNGAYAAMARGPRRGSPMHGCLVDITFDSSTDYFGNDTDAAHVVNAAFHAIKAALSSAHGKKQVGVLEPVMMVEIQCPEKVAGDIQKDIQSSRGGHILEMNDNTAAFATGNVKIEEVYAPPDPYETTGSLREDAGGGRRMLELVAKVPLKEMLDYDSVLRSMTKGSHTLSMSPDTFDRVVGSREKNL